MKPKLASLLEVESSGQSNTASGPELHWYHNSSIWKLDKEKGLLKHEQATDDPLWNYMSMCHDASFKMPWANYHMHAWSIDTWFFLESAQHTGFTKLQKCQTKIPQQLVLSYKP
jgi:hypothetical protein